MPVCVPQRCAELPGRWTAVCDRGLAAAFEACELELPPGYAMRSVTPPDSWIGLAVDALPSAARADVVVVLLLRSTDGREQVLAATAEQVVDAGDQVVVLGTRAAVRELQALAGEA